MNPDLVFVNGTVITVDPSFRTTKGLAVGGGRIVAVGDEAEIRALAGPRTRVIDLANGAVLPGINDSHLHAAMLGAYWPGLWMHGLANGAMPKPRELATPEDRRAALRRAWDVLVPLGITSYTEPGLGPGADGQHGGSCGAGMLTAYAELAAEIPCRVNILLLFGELDGPGEPADLRRGLREFADDHGGPPLIPSLARGSDVTGGLDRRRLVIAGVKIFADGIPPMRTAWMSEPYENQKGRGELITTGADDAERLAKLRTMIQDAHRAGHQIGVHATGDAAIDAVARMLPVNARHYVIHGDCASPAALTTMARHGIGLNTQPALYEATRTMLTGALGERRAATAFPLRSAIGKGVPLCLSSDAPVMTPDWRAGLAAALNMGVTMADAIRGYTIMPARQDRAERWKGSIEIGKVADLCVLETDPLTLKPEEIPQVGVAMTIVGGAVVHDANTTSKG